MNIGSRIKKVRRELDLTQTEFASMLGLTQNTVTRYETGDRSPSNAVISLIVKAYNVNEKWLRTGEGELFTPVPKSQLEVLASQFPNITHETCVFVEKLINLPKSSQNIIMSFLREVVENFNNTSPVTSLEGDFGQDMTDDEIEREVGDYRRQLIQEKEAEEKSKASPESRDKGA